jgi:hypothetical protein
MRKPRLFLILLAWTLVGIPACAQWSIHVTVRSYHFNRSENFNEWNVGFGVGYDVGTVATPQVGVYLNSDSDLSPYAIATLEWPEDTFLAAGTQIGMVGGYDKYPIMPFFAVGVGIGYNPQLRIAYIPYEEGLLASRIKYEVE